MKITTTALLFTGLVTLIALAGLDYAWHTAQPADGYRAAFLLVLAGATARLKVRLPGLTGNMAVNLPFLLLAITQLSLLEAVIVAVPSCALQCIPRDGDKFKPIQIAFNLSVTVVAVVTAGVAGAHSAVLCAAVFFLMQTIPVACIISLTEGGRMGQHWCTIAHYSFPFYVLSAGITLIASSYINDLGWQLPVLGLPVLYAIYCSYESYFRVPPSSTVG